jgi:hypothetical protein
MLAGSDEKGAPVMELLALGLFVVVLGWQVKWFPR